MQNLDAKIALANDTEYPQQLKRQYVKIVSIEKITHDVLKITTEKPLNYPFTPGQATELAINKPGWQNERRPFTFTSLPGADYLEFIIKTYPDHHGVTHELLQLKENDELILHEVFGAIAYKGEGVFIAGGAGVTPFIAILRQLERTNQIRNNKMIFANKTRADIILEEYFKELLGTNFINILSGEKTIEYSYGHITKEFLLPHLDDINQKFYICGPQPMMETVEEQLMSLKVNEASIIKEEF